MKGLSSSLAWVPPLLGAACLWIGLEGAGAGQPSAPPPSQATAAPGGAPGGTAPPVAVETPAFPGGRFASAEATVVGGNVAGARDRALGEAMKQAVEQALLSLVPDARATQSKTVTRLLGRSRGYVRRYRTIEEGERGRGLYALRIEADVDEAALLREIDKSSATAAIAAPTGGAIPSCLLVGAGAVEAAAAVARNLSASGVRVIPGAPESAEPAKALEAAARAGASVVAFAGGNATAEGKVRGAGVESVSCGLGLRMLAAGSGASLADERETVRAFADQVDAARALCFQRAAAAVIPRVVAATAGRFGPDGRTTAIDVDVAESGAVPALLRQLRELGSVSGIEVRRIVPGHAEVWVRSRLGAAGLAAALGRETNGALVFSGVEVAGDLVRARARLRDNAPPAPASAPATTVPGAGGAADNVPRPGAP